MSTLWVSDIRKAAKNLLQLTTTDRYSAYNYWSIDLPSDQVSGNFTNSTTFFSSPIVKAGYLVRTVKVDKDNVYLTGDFNATTDIEIIGANKATKSLFVNGKSTEFQQDFHGVIKAVSTFVTPSFSLPNLSKIDWKVLNSLPEIQPGMLYRLSF
jgi:hypothetical protein